MQPSIATVTAALQAEPKKKRSQRRGKKVRKQAETIATSTTTTAIAGASTTKVVLVDLNRASASEQEVLINKSKAGEVKEGMLLGDQLWVKGSSLSSAAAALAKSCASAQATKSALPSAADETEGFAEEVKDTSGTWISPCGTPVATSRTSSSTVASGTLTAALPPASTASVAGAPPVAVSGTQTIAPGPQTAAPAFASGMGVASQGSQAHSAEQEKSSTVPPPGWQPPVPESEDSEWPHNLIVTEGIPSMLPQKSTKELPIKPGVRDLTLKYTHLPLGCTASKSKDGDFRQGGSQSHLQGKAEDGQSKALGGDLPPGVSELPPEMLIYAPPPGVALQPKSLVLAAGQPEPVIPSSDSQSTTGAPASDSQSESSGTPNLSTETMTRSTKVVLDGVVAVSQVTASTASKSAPRIADMYGQSEVRSSETKTTKTAMHPVLGAVNVVSVDQGGKLARQQAVEVKDLWLPGADVNKVDVEEGELPDFVEPCNSKASEGSYPKKGAAPVSQYKAKVLGVTTHGVQIAEMAQDPPKAGSEPKTENFLWRKPNKTLGKPERRKKEKRRAGQGRAVGEENAAALTFGSLWEQEVRELYDTESA